MDLDLPRPALGLVITTQVFLGILFVVGLAAIALLPGFSSRVAMSLPEYAELRDPLLAIAISVTILGLIALAMVALLVHRIYAGTMLTRTSLLWVDVIVATLFCAVVLDIVGVVAISNAQAGNPFLGIVQAVACLTVVALACITLVLRSLLRGAIVMRAELDDVV
ncbi:hypothetical protein BOH66_04865 [Microbacterium aurum]|uniref:DUF2975 domain-containing protein n=1 Tax=Microbacterium aurum TaxID=36805 RepID=A0A1P8U6C6_9MICO|nr:DUF2975 domain-containing protein [Microbacterium aurum]APZ33672.1 hypothetical protein BOH66_04865 [Microbacterium aurum]MBM7827385.1 hypothetical protein [Microbacterium aurum]